MMEVGVESTNRENEDEIESNYDDENKMNYRDFEDVDLEISYNNISLLRPCLAKTRF